jgi:hypothetical protein
MLTIGNVIDAVLCVPTSIIFYNGIYLKSKNNRKSCLTQFNCVVIKYINYYG